MRRAATTPDRPAIRGSIPLIAADRAATMRSEETLEVRWCDEHDDCARRRGVDGESESDDVMEAWKHGWGMFDDDDGAARGMGRLETTGETDYSRRLSSPMLPTWAEANANYGNDWRRRGRLDTVRMKRSTSALNGEGHSSGKHMCALERLRLPTREEKVPCGRGIANLGNSCYVSAALQMFRSMKCFVNDIATLSDENALADKPLLRALDEHFSCVENRSAAGVKREMAKVSRRIRRFRATRRHGIYAHDARDD